MVIIEDYSNYTLVEDLINFGLTQNEAKIYINLLKNVGNTARELTLNSGVPRNKTYTALYGLQKKGFAYVVDDPVQHFYPINIDESLEQVIKNRLMSIDNLKEFKKRISNNFSNLKDDIKIQPQENQFITLRGTKEVNHTAFLALDREKDKVIWANNIPGLKRNYRDFGKQLESLSNRGVNIRILSEINKSNLSEAKKMAKFCSIGEMKNVPLRLCGTSNEVMIGLISDKEHESYLGFWTANTFFVNSVWESYENWWFKSTPII